MHGWIDGRPRSSSLNPEQFLEAMAKPGTDTGHPRPTCVLALLCLLVVVTELNQHVQIAVQTSLSCPIRINPVNSGRVDTTFCFSNKLTKKVY